MHELEDREKSSSESDVVIAIQFPGPEESVYEHAGDDD